MQCMEIMAWHYSQQIGLIFKHAELQILALSSPFPIDNEWRHMAIMHLIDIPTILQSAGC